MRSEVVVVPSTGPWEGNRDVGKRFVVTERPALQAEKWAWRLAIAVKGTSAQVPVEQEKMGMVGIAIRGLNSFLAADVDFAKIEPLLDEMMQCVQIVRDPNARDKITGGPVGTPLVSQDDVQEVQTILWLRGEVIRIHTNFSSAEALSTWFWTMTAPALNSSSAPTSRD